MNTANSAINARGNGVLVLLLLALAGYLLPWVTAPNAAMTLNAFDLAEWTSLHPIQQQAMPPLIVPLLLRAQLAILAVLIALWSISRNERFFAILFVALLSVSQLPPLEFLNNVADLNYRQLLFLALATIILTTGLGLILPAQFRPFVIIFLAVSGIVTSLLGQSQAIELYQVTLEQGETGGGLWLIVVAYAAISLNGLRRFLSRR
ncbi:MAG: hypothetical protein OXG39_03125 [Chloroflexi bacterium]|nr:hypothetical protein [Chloroflexota bacterium]